ncbi:MAG: CTP synthase, partial [Patescibacteria group bacterium]
NEERTGKYLGKPVQVIPHLTDLIQKKIVEAGSKSDVHIVEIGGTVGDFESPAFVEAIRELGFKQGRHGAVFVHVVYAPYLGASGEFKTKPAQNAVRDLRAVGIMPDILAVRTESQPGKEIVTKTSMFSGVPEEAIVLLPNAKSIYQVPLTLEDSKIGDYILDRLHIKAKKPENKDWKTMVDLALTKNRTKRRIAFVAKYLDNQDTYISVFEALRSAALWEEIDLDIDWIDSEKLNSADQLKEYDGVLVPGGFGVRGAEGKIFAADWAYKSKTPYLGLCLGLQVAVIAAVRRQLGTKDVNSVEFDANTKNPVIYTMPDQLGKENTGGTMRLGDYDCKIDKKSKVYNLYKSQNIVERHRHRYECNNDYVDILSQSGINIVGRNIEKNLVEIIEAKDHPFYVASQFHPEFKSRPVRPHPLFSGFIKALK